MGPSAQLPSAPEKLNLTSFPVWELFSGAAKTVPPKIGSGSFIDVRDVSTIHIWAFEHPGQSDGERYIAVSSMGPPQAVADILRKQYPNRRDIIPEGTPGEGYGPEYTFDSEGFSIDSSKATKAVGIKWRKLEESITEQVKAYEAWL
jgi:nucleoside-diphosphate-sugar epimerase